jgi:hypothetical protein
MRRGRLTVRIFFLMLEYTKILKGYCLRYVHSVYCKFNSKMDWKLIQLRQFKKRKLIWRWGLRFSWQLLRTFTKSSPSSHTCFKCICVYLSAFALYINPLYFNFTFGPPTGDLFNIIVLTLKEVWLSLTHNVYSMYHTLPSLWYVYFCSWTTAQFQKIHKSARHKRQTQLTTTFFKEYVKQILENKSYILWSIFISKMFRR